MKALHDLKRMLHEELEELSHKSDLSAGDLEMVHKLTDTIKNIDKICMLEDGGEYSHRGMDYTHHTDPYDRDTSYANRGKHYVRGHYSRDGGKGGVMEHLQMALDEATTEREREEIRRVMRKFEDS